MQRTLAASLFVVAHTVAQVTVNVTPSASLFAGAVYDTARRRVVAFDAFGDTWEVAGTEFLHRARALGGSTEPGARVGAALVYDAARRRVLLVGGQANSTVLSDTWSWDGVQWRLVAAGPTGLARFNTSMCFDSVRNRVVLFGGNRINGSSLVTLADTWEHDGVTWQLQSPTTTPSGAVVPRLAFDSGRAVTVLNVWPGSTTGSTWEWNGTNWTLRQAAGGPGPQQQGCALAYDPVRARTVAIGGGTFTGAPIPPGQEVWEWDGTTWTRVALLPTVLRNGCGAWFDPDRGRLIVGGGSDSQGVADLGTFTWDGSALTTLASDEMPLFRSDVALMPRLDGGATLFGGQTFQGSTSILHGDTWRWDGRTWTRLAPPVSPSPRSAAATTEQILMGRCLMFGGTSQGDDFWAFDGSAWTQLSNGPLTRSWAAMAEDRTGAVVLFGGSGRALLDDTWTWNGTWVPRDPLAVHPPARYMHAMAFDGARGVTVLYGGYGSGGRLADTWEWDGLQWQQRPSTSLALDRPAMVFDWNTTSIWLSGTNPLPIGGGLALPTGIPWLMEYQPGTGWQGRATRPVELLSIRRMICDWTRGSLVEFDSLKLREWSFQPAEAVLIGAGCSTPEPLLTVRARPRSGEPHCGFDLTAQPLRHCVFALDATLTNTPLGSSCTAFVGPTALLWLGFTDAAGFAELQLAVPTDPLLRGQQLFAQAAARDPNAPLGFGLSRGLRLRIGD